MRWNDGHWLEPTWTKWAPCRWCGGSIAVHKARNGAFVLFNVLGPPWTKHRCAAYESRYDHLAATSIDANSVRPNVLADAAEYRRVAEQVVAKAQAHVGPGGFIDVRMGADDVQSNGTPTRVGGVAVVVGTTSSRETAIVLKHAWLPTVTLVLMERRPIGFRP